MIFDLFLDKGSKEKQNKQQEMAYNLSTKGTEDSQRQKSGRANFKESPSAETYGTFGENKDTGVI